MGAPEKYTVAQIQAALEETRGTITLAADRLGAAYNTVKRYVDRSPTLQQIVEKYREQRVDKAELALERAIGNGEPWAVSLTLKTIGKRRGYVERIEQDMNPEGKDIVIRYSDDHDTEAA